MDYVLRTENLQKHYRRCKALDGLTMAVPKGSIYGLVGRNGAGKTTLIRVVCALQFPTGGSYELYGRSDTARDAARSRRRVGAVIETPSIYSGLSARENLRQQYNVLGLPSYDGLEELLELVDLRDTGRKPAKDFSLGMRQRLGIAVALAGDPDFLILDEPANGLDPQGIVEIRELILRLNREKQITVLISSHILDELAKLATHYGFIDNGRMVREISARELESLCRKRTRLTVSDTTPLPAVPDRLGLAYEVRSGNTADVYGELSVTELTLALHQAGCEIKNIHEMNETLESYYMDLMGGGARA